MKNNPEKVYQFKITLEDIKPTIWRRIQVPEWYSFWDLHAAIQDAMGWSDSHLHRFEIKNPAVKRGEKIGIPCDEEIDYEIKILPGWEKKISKYFTFENNIAKYIYDFGDNWAHAIKFEGILLADERTVYPVCIDGKRKCPPEDVGGCGGYDNFLDVISNPDDEECESTLEWVGGEFNPEYFKKEKIKFSNPQKRLELMLKS